MEAPENFRGFILEVALFVHLCYPFGCQLVPYGYCL